MAESHSNTLYPQYFHPAHSRKDGKWLLSQKCKVNGDKLGNRAVTRRPAFTVGWLCTKRQGPGTVCAQM